MNDITNKYMITYFRNMYASEEGIPYILGGIEQIYEKLKETENKKVLWKDKIKEVKGRNKKIYNDIFPLWSPNIYSDNHRLKDKAISMCCFVFDIDYGSPTIEKLEQSIPYKMIIHRSFNWSPNNMRWRVIVPVDEMIIFSDNKTEREAVMAHMFDWWKAFFSGCGIILDEACKDMARQFFVPVSNIMSGYGPDLRLYVDGRETFPVTTIPEYVPPAPKPIKKPKPKTTTASQTFYQDLENNNFFDDKLREWIGVYSNLNDGEHYTKFYNLITAVRKRHFYKFRTEIDLYILEQIMTDIDYTCSQPYSITSGYGSEYITKKIQENYKQRPTL